MGHTPLSAHKLKKGIFITPLNEVCTPLMDNETWLIGRIPEYLWIGFIVNNYNRKGGMYKACLILNALYNTTKELQLPRMSDILALPDEIQNKFYNEVLKIVPIEVLSPLTLIYTSSKYPIFSRRFFCSFDIDCRKKKIEEMLSKILDHQSFLSTDIRYLTICFEGFRKKVRVAGNSEMMIKALNEYPYTEHDNPIMGCYRSNIRSLELMAYQMCGIKSNSKYIDFFWHTIGMLTDCKLFQVNFTEEERNMDLYLKKLQGLFSFLNTRYSKKILDEKSEVIIAIATYSYKRFKELVSHNLSNTILGRSCFRGLFESYIMLKYLLKHENEHENIWRDFKIYGLGKYKSTVLKHREYNIHKPESHINLEYIDSIVNEFTMEDVINIDTSYFDNTNIRKKAEDVGELELYSLYYNYSSSYEHGLWGAIRESSMLKCRNPAHQCHCVPDIDSIQNVKSVLPDSLSLMNKIMEVLNDIFEFPPNSFKEIKDFEK